MNDRADCTLFCLAGCPGAGKSTMRKRLLDAYPTALTFLGRYTTRPVRPGEDDEVVQLPRAAFVTESRAGNLIAQFCANRAMYALSLAELEALLAAGTHRWIGCLSASAAVALTALGHAVRTIYLTVHERAALVSRVCERLRQSTSDHEAILLRMNEFDTADAEWCELTADLVLETDRLTEEETFESIRNFLGLPELPPPA